MAPGIADGALVSVARRPRYWPGDVLVFRAADGRLMAHRLIGAFRWRGQTRLFTRADNAQKLDTAICAADVIGRVVGGDCDRRIAAVPLSQRAASFAIFLRRALARAARRYRWP
jgi:hypothetical protein